MITIHKFPLTDPVGEPVEMPQGTKVLVVGAQYDRGRGCEVPVIWAMVDTDAPLVTRQFTFHGTGHPIPNGGTYLGTAFCGPFVWHVFERGQ